MENNLDKKAYKMVVQGNNQGLEILFKTYFHFLYIQAYRFVSNKEIAEELTQDVFVSLWEKRKTIKIEGNIKAYLSTAIKNKSLNYLKTSFSKQYFIGEIPELPQVDYLSESKELEQLIEEAIEGLPEKCGIIFRLSRFSDMTYDEIANHLGISKDTVKTQIKTALSRIRAFLGKHWEIMLVITGHFWGGKTFF